MTFKHYDVVRAASPSDLAERLTQKLKEGWQPFGSPVAITPYTLMQAIAAADYLSLHMPSLPSTRGMIGRQALSLCKKGVRIINYARGGLVDEAALLEALADGRVAAYVISCVLFAFMHVWTFALSSWDWSYLILMLQYLVPGLVFAWAFDHSGTLWTSILLHATVNALALWAIVG